MRLTLAVFTFLWLISACGVERAAPKKNAQPSAICTSDVECPDGYTCDDGTCVADTSACNPACDIDETCQAGVCVTNDEEDCVPACPSNQICEQGVCVGTGPNPCSPACAVGQTCDDGVCVDVVVDGCTPACGTSAECVEGTCITIPDAWVCANAWYVDTECDCDCGAEDAACAVLGVTCDGGDVCEPACAADESCVDGVCVPPTQEGWLCNPTFFGTSDGCDCGCGVADPDCAGAGCTEGGCLEASCEFCYDGGLPTDCVPTVCDPVCAEGETCLEGICVSAAWECSQDYFGTDDGCDCGCGVPDPDCDGGGCAESGCSVAGCTYCYVDGGFSSCGPI